MNENEELIKNLRSVKDTWQTQEEEWMLRAADAIEKLMALTADDIPTAPHEMSAREFARERGRMCVHYNLFCGDCPVLPERMEGGKVMHDCPIWTMRDPDKAVAIVEKWAQEHHEGGK